MSTIAKNAKLLLIPIYSTLDMTHEFTTTLSRMQTIRNNSVLQFYLEIQNAATE